MIPARTSPRSAGIPACGFTGHPCPVFRNLGTDAQATRRLGSLRYIVACLLLSLLPLRAEVFTLVQWGDVHANITPAGTALSTNAINWILANTNPPLNVRLFVSTGDCYEQSIALASEAADKYTTPNWINDLWRLKTNGIRLFITDGNHDCDGTTNVAGWAQVALTEKLWNTIYPHELFDTQPGYVESRLPGDNKSYAITYTNAGVKLLLASYHSEPDNVTSNAATTYHAQTLWASNLLARFPDHNGILASHFHLDTNMVPAYADGTGGAYTNIGPGLEPLEHGMLKLPNFAAFLSGHTRPAYKGSYLTNGTDGHAVRLTTFNTQTVFARNGDYMNLFIFDTRTGVVSNRTFCISENRYLTNNDESLTNGNRPNGFEHEWAMRLPIMPAPRLVIRRP